jgi:hypothetical protein
MRISVATRVGPWQTKGETEGTAMKKTVTTVALLGLLVGAPVAGRAADQGSEAGFSALSAVANLGYTPAKVVVATGGMIVGALAGFFTGGDTRAAYAFWVPAAGGAYFLTPANMDGREPIRFFGDDYVDRPSHYCRETHGTVVYDAMYDHDHH